MNRRGFFAFLVAAPAAAVAGLRPQRPITFARIWDMIKDFERPRRPTMTPKQWSDAVAKSTYRMADEMSAGDGGTCMPKTKPYIDEQWRRYYEAMRRDA